MILAKFYVRWDPISMINRPFCTLLHNMINLHFCNKVLSLATYTCWNSCNYCIK